MVYIISEISNQWGGSMNVAEQMILQSKMGGADAVKVQLFGNDWKPERCNPDSGKDYLSFTYDEAVSLRAYADMLRIDFFASPFDEERLEWCKELKLPFIKIGNGVYKKFPGLVKKAINSGLKVVISLDREEIGAGCLFQNERITYLYTERKYPANLEDIDMPDFSQSFVSGYSDHTFGLSACFYALSRGAGMIEKHFTISKSWQKISESAHFGSMDFDELRTLKSFSRDINILRNRKTLSF